MSAEGWRDVVGHPNYEVSSLGRVRSHKGLSPRVLAARSLPKGYLRVTLYDNGRRVGAYVHTLVLEAFVHARTPGMQVRHLDGNPTNNHVDNLAWGTQGDNERDKVAHGTHPGVNKTECLRGHAYTPANTYITPGTDAKRSCLTCRTESARRRRRQRQAARQEAAA